MKLDQQQIIAKLKEARGLVRDVRNCFEGSSLEYYRCFCTVSELDFLINFFDSNEI